MELINKLKDACNRVIATEDAHKLLMEYANAWATDNGHESYDENDEWGCSTHQFVDFCKPLNDTIVEIGIKHITHYRHGSDGGTTIYYVDFTTDTELEHNAVKHLLKD